jgi:hypothetical protein
MGLAGCAPEIRVHEEHEFGPDDEPDDRPRDAKVDEAKEALIRFFRDQPQGVFYHRQITIHFEGRFFHWITGKALRELESEAKIAAAAVTPLRWSGRPLKFYFAPKNRYWKRQAKRASALVMRFSADNFGKALGLHGEMMVDAALPRAGLTPVARDTRSYEGRTWTKSEHELDRVFLKGRIGYGVEIKNTLDYIARAELEIKVAMCGHLGLVPLFVVRMAPKSYVQSVHQAGGFTLVLKYQLYPFGHEALAREVREVLNLPVDTPRALQDGTIQRVANFVKRTESSVNSVSNSQNLETSS